MKNNKQIIVLISDYIKKKHNDEQCNCEYKKLHGCSGDDVYYVTMNNEPYCIVKIFNNKKNGIAEAESYKFLKKHKFKTVEVLYSFAYQSSFVLLTSIANGILGAKVVQENVGDFDLLKKLGNNIGLTLRRLHEIEKFKVLKPVISKFSNVNDDIKKKFILNPGDFTYVHGDLSLVNLFFDDQFNVILIDSGGLIKHYDNHPIGFPGCDYYRFICSVNLFVEKSGIEEIKESLIQGFMSGYGNKYEIFTKESESLFKCYWEYIEKKIKKRYGK